MDKRKGIWAGFKKSGPTSRFSLLTGGLLTVPMAILAIFTWITGVSKTDVKELHGSMDTQHHQEMGVLENVQSGVTRVEGLLSQRSYKSLGIQHRQAMIVNLRKMKDAISFQEITLSAQAGNQNRQKIAQEIAEILGGAGFNVQPNYNVGRVSEHLPSPIEAACNPVDRPKVEELFRTLQPILRSTEIGLSTSEKRLVGTLHIALVGEPAFSEDGSIQFQ